MKSVNKTLYIPLYGKSYVSKKGLFLRDKKAEAIWEAEGFPLKGKARSKYLAYYLGIRCAVFDAWLKQMLYSPEDTVVLHIGCGLDSRAQRLDAGAHKWYDIDFPEVIAERKRYFCETASYQMLEGDARDPHWLERIPENKHAIVVMEGVSMYLTEAGSASLLDALSGHFETLSLLMDCYSLLAAKLSKYRNPVGQVGVTRVYGIDDPRVLENDRLIFTKEHTMTPQGYIDQLSGVEKYIFQKLYAGRFSKKLYRLFEYRTRQAALVSKL